MREVVGMTQLAESDTCDLCGAPTYGESTVCRRCRKLEEANRRTLRLAQERRRRRQVYGRV